MQALKAVDQQRPGWEVTDQEVEEAETDEQGRAEVRFELQRDFADGRGGQWVRGIARASLCV